ncbi:MAG: glycoside hydrolase family 2 [Oscillospiraceae bacterium]|nr:glycoside hydrolase family 2 [Oscillospiraceae bacterium]
MERLYTKTGRELKGLPWMSYPRPQLRREDWLCLNGEWQLQIRERGKKGGLLRRRKGADPERGKGAEGRETAVRVPFCPESLLSGVERPPEIGEEMVYRRSFRVPESWAGRRVLLHFGAVMRETAVAVNGRELARHENGYLPFTVDVTEALVPGPNELAVTVVNDLDQRFPWGKQRRDRGGMWYTPCSGIWQTVWLEPVPETYVRRLEIHTGLDWAEIRAEGVREGEVLADGRRYPLTEGRAHIRLEQPRLWSPEHPELYPFVLMAGEDKVESYFALRTLTVEERRGKMRLCLNGEPYFFHGLLDQGYWSDGLYTPASPMAYVMDITAMKRLGFNTLRKHIKIEPERFYYDCDRLGMIVFQDMVNNGDYRYLRDTALPTAKVNLRTRDEGLHPDPEGRRNFLQAMEETVRLLQSHPCVCLWTIFNEGWGQFCADDAYARLKELDPERFVDATSGWFKQTKSDVESLHIYFDKLQLGKEHRPQLLSEFGGYVWKSDEHSADRDKTYGYRIYGSREELVRGIQSLYWEHIVPLVRQGLCGAVYTQVSDVEDETNGLLTFDRAVQKLRPVELAGLARALQEAVRD